MSMYAKGWIYQTWLIASVPLCILIEPLGGNVPLAAMALIVSPAAIMFTLLRCAECRTSIFRVGPDYFPMYTTWPHRVCRGCGADNRASDVRT